MFIQELLCLVHWTCVHWVFSMRSILLMVTVNDKGTSRASKCNMSFLSLQKSGYILSTIWQSDQPIDYTCIVQKINLMVGKVLCSNGYGKMLSMSLFNRCLLSPQFWKLKQEAISQFHNNHNCIIDTNGSQMAVMVISTHYMYWPTPIKILPIKTTSWLSGGRRPYTVSA